MRHIERTIAALAGLNERIAVAARAIAWTFIAIMLAIVCLSVFFRYVLNNSLTWAEDVSLMMAIWMTMAVAPLAYRAGANVALETVSSRLDGRALESLRLASHLLILTLLGFLIYESWGFMERGFRIRANTVPIQMGVIYAILPTSFASMVLVGVELSLRSIVGLANPASPFSRPPDVHLGAEPADI